MAVITFSRECGSRGEEIARQIAEKLGYGYFDKEILAEVAREVHTTEEKISEYDEKDEHGLRAFLKKRFVPSKVPPNYLRFHELPYYFSPSVPLEWSLESRSAQPALDADEVTSFFRRVVEKLWKRL